MLSPYHLVGHDVGVDRLRLGCAIPGFSIGSHGTRLFIPGNSSTSLIPTARGGECEALAVFI
jgi:hypothetical protein